MNDSIDHICRIRMCGWMRCLETATLIDCDINKYSSWLHQFQHIFRDKMRRLITWYEHTTHNDIHICQFSTNIMLVGIERVYIDRQLHL